MKAFGTCLKVLKATNEKSESLRMSLNLLKRIFNILKWLSKSEEISFRAKRREGVERDIRGIAVGLHDKSRGFEKS